MFGLNGTLRVVLLLLVLSYLPACCGQVDTTRVFLENPTYKKSCPHGMIAEKDYFILNGKITISRIKNGRYGKFSIHWVNRWLGFVDFLRYSVTDLRWTGCTDIAVVENDTCKCQFFELEYVLVKCNVTARMWFNRGIINLLFVTEGAVDAYRSHWLQMPYVYASSACKLSWSFSVNQAAKNHPESLSALLGM